MSECESVFNSIVIVNVVCLRVIDDIPMIMQNIILQKTIHQFVESFRNFIVLFYIIESILMLYLYWVKDSRADEEEDVFIYILLLVASNVISFKIMGYRIENSQEFLWHVLSKNLIDSSFVLT